MLPVRLCFSLQDAMKADKEVVLKAMMADPDENPVRRHATSG